MLVHAGGSSEDQALLFVFLLDGDCAGDGVTYVDGGGIYKMHFCGEETDHAADVGDHTAGEQAWNDAPPEPTTLYKYLVDMVWVVVAGDATELGNVAFGEGAAEGEGLSYLDGVEGVFELLFEFWRCAWHVELPFLCFLFAQERVFPHYI
jgi:hypothetical protein